MRIFILKIINNWFILSSFLKIEIDHQLAPKGKYMNLFYF